MKNIFLTGLIAGIAMIVANMILNPIFEMVFPGLQAAYMGNPAFRPWQDPIMMLFFLYPIALGMALAWVWTKTKHLFAKSSLKNGLNFGMVYFFVAGIPTFLINFSSFTFPLAMIFSWSLMGIIDGFVAGLVLAKLNK